MKTHPLMLLCLMALTACGSAPPAQQANTVPLRSGQQIATQVGEKTREVQAKNKDMVLYATSIEANKEAETPGEASMGSITVYSKPRGEIVLDGAKTGVQTPDTVEAPEGRHELQVIFEGGETSELKVVRIRQGSRVKLFFRSEAPETPEAMPEPEVTPPTPKTTP